VITVIQAPELADARVAAGIGVKAKAGEIMDCAKPIRL
jgi:hypothetical protein